MSNKPNESNAAEETKSAAKGFFEFTELFVFAVAIILILFSFFVRQTVVDGGSMDQTLANGERLLVSDLFYTPASGDIIVFQSASTGFSYPLVKRVIATEGQTVRIEADGVYVNGVLLQEDYAFTNHHSYSYTSDKAILLGVTYTVPEDSVFVLGDHRNSSIDGRDFGFIKESDILGRVILRLTPFDRFGAVN